MPKPPESGGFGRRVLSSLILIPVVLAITWAGSPWLTLLIAAIAGGMVWEWGVLIGRRRSAIGARISVGLAVASVLIGGFWSMPAGIVLGIVNAVTGTYVMRGRGARAFWTLIGLLWIILPCIGFVWLRDQPQSGRATILWMLALVWAVDTAAYAAGKGIGGPKLAPRISPKKTWAGLVGGVAGALIVGFVSAWLTAKAHWWQIMVMSGLLAIVEQAGDIAESYAKRRFGVKDSSALIPGHGGLLDRLDGMLAVIVAVLILSLATGRNVLTWH